MLVSAPQINSEADASQFQLLRQRRFAPLFFTQFFGAFNDNLFRNAMTLMFVYGGLVAADSVNTFVNAAAGLFILPFFLFSALAGQLADKYEKSRLIRIIKVCEILIALLGALAVYSQNVPFMLTVLFLLGTQSAFFGPLKYSILPQHLHESELVGGNAQIEMGTFVSILLGTIAGGVVAGLDNVSLFLSVFVVMVALVGYTSSRFIPLAPATEPDLAVGWNVARETWRMVGMARENRTVFLSILGISWFWLLGSAFIAQIPNLTRLNLGGGTTVVTLILAVFTIAIALGSLACERLSGQKVEIGIVPMGAFGLSLAGLDLFFALTQFDSSAPVQWLGFLASDGAIRVLVDFALIGFFGGMFIVPLYALIQLRTPESRRARIIAVNNVINSVFMVTSAVLAIAFLEGAGFTIPQLLLTLIVMNVAVSAFIFYTVPEFAMRFLVWLLSHSMYRVRHDGLAHIPDEGPAVLVCNHVTFVDALLLAGAVRRPVRFIMFKPIFDIPVLNFVFRTSRAIPIQGRSEDAAAYEAAFAQIRAGLAAGDLLCIFPEGALTRDGEMQRFRPGIERILSETPVPVVPMALKGLWGSFFSHHEGVFSKPFRRIWSRVDIVAAPAVPAMQATASHLEELVRGLRGDAR